MVTFKEVSPKKISFVQQVTDLNDQYHKFIIFQADNVGASQIQSIRKLLRGRAELIMGKNSLFKKAFIPQYEKYPSLQKIVPQIVGNVGFLFTNEPTLGECRSILETLSEFKPPKTGAIAQCDVVVPKGVTSISPEKTSFFQSLNISTMINKGCIEIMNDVHLIKAGNKVGESEVTLLTMLGVKPFAYKLTSKVVYDNGDVYSPSVLDITSDDWVTVTKEAIESVTALALGAGHFTKCSAPHSILYAFKSIVGAYLELGIETERTKAIQSAIDSAASVVAAPAASAASDSAAKVEETKEEEESDDDLGFSLFD